MILVILVDFLLGVITGIALCSWHVYRHRSRYPWMPSTHPPQIERGDAITVSGEVGASSVKNARIRTRRISPRN